MIYENGCKPYHMMVHRDKISDYILPLNQLIFCPVWSHRRLLDPMALNNTMLVPLFFVVLISTIIFKTSSLCLPF